MTVVRYSERTLKTLRTAILIIAGAVLILLSATVSRTVKERVGAFFGLDVVHADAPPTSCSSCAYSQASYTSYSQGSYVTYSQGYYDPKSCGSCAGCSADGSSDSADCSY